MGDHQRIRKAERKRADRIERNLRIEARLGNEPDGLKLIGRSWYARCKSCGHEYDTLCDAAEFDEDMSYCGGNPWCIP